MIVFISIVTLLLIGIVVMAIRDNKDNALYREEVQRLKQVYETTLTGKDRKAALKAGRSYYSMARKGNAPTAYDEQTMANDLNAMAMEVFSTEPTVKPVVDSIIPERLTSH